MSLSPDSSFSAPALDFSMSNVASSHSTPPTTVADSASLHSDTSKNDVITVAVDAETEPIDHPMPDADPDHGAHAHPERDNEPDESTARDSEPATPGRPRRTRGAPPVYNLSKLAGTADHGKRRANGDVVADRRRRTIGGTTMSDEQAANGTPQRASPRSKRANASIDALNLSTTPKGPKTTKGAKSSRTQRKTEEPPRPVRVTRHTPAPQPEPTTTGRRGRKSTGKVEESRLPRELRRLQDTKEFSHVDEKPVITTVWSKGKYVNPNDVDEEPARKKAKAEPASAEEADKESPEPVDTKQKRVKKYLSKGLYAGQDGPADFAKGLTPAEKKSLSELPELKPSGRVNTVMPLPIYAGMRTLISGRDFKLPFSVCNPLPPGQPKPDEWKKMTKSMSHAIYKGSFQTCVLTRLS